MVLLGKDGDHCDNEDDAGLTVEDGFTQSTPAEGAKKKRGRPRKTKPENEGDADKRTPKKRGRPRKIKEEKKEDTDEGPPKKRGRPRKIKDASDNKGSSVNGENNQPKKRGRPRKISPEKEGDADDHVESNKEKLVSQKNEAACEKIEI